MILEESGVSCPASQQRTLRDTDKTAPGEGGGRGESLSLAPFRSTSTCLTRVLHLNLWYRWIWSAGSSRCVPWRPDLNRPDLPWGGCWRGCLSLDGARGAGAARRRPTRQAPRLEQWSASCAKTRSGGFAAACQLAETRYLTNQINDSFECNLFFLLVNALLLTFNRHHSSFTRDPVTLESLIEERGDWFPRFALIGGIHEIRNSHWRDAKVTWPVDVSLSSFRLSKLHILEILR